MSTKRKKYRSRNPLLEDGCRQELMLEAFLIEANEIVIEHNRAIERFNATIRRCRPKKLIPEITRANLLGLRDQNEVMCQRRILVYLLMFEVRLSDKEIYDYFGRGDYKNFCYKMVKKIRESDKPQIIRVLARYYQRLARHYASTREPDSLAPYATYTLEPLTEEHELLLSVILSEATLRLRSEQHERAWITEHEELHTPKFVTRDEMLGTNPGKIYEDARHIFIYLLRKDFKLTLERIGKNVGGRDRHKIIYALRVFEKRLASDPSLVEYVDRVRERLQKSGPGHVVPFKPREEMPESDAVLISKAS